jgi:hypothetical protein
MVYRGILFLINGIDMQFIRNSLLLILIAFCFLKLDSIMNSSNNVKKDV